MKPLRPNWSMPVGTPIKHSRLEIYTLTIQADADGREFSWWLRTEAGGLKHTSHTPFDSADEALEDWRQFGTKHRFMLFHEGNADKQADTEPDGVVGRRAETDEPAATKPALGGDLSTVAPAFLNRFLKRS